MEVVGGPGKGPLEFQRPRSIDLIDNHSFRVWDANRSFKTISLEGGERVEEDFRSIDIAPDYGCKFGDTMVAFGLNYGEAPHHLVHLLNEQGQVTKSFGDAYLHPDLGAVLNSSNLAGTACFQEVGRLAIAFQLMPLVLSYSIDGDLEWVRYCQGPALFPTGVTSIPQSISDVKRLNLGWCWFQFQCVFECCSSQFFSD